MQFAAGVVNGYNIGSDQVRVALIVFSDKPRIVFDFDTYTAKAQVIAAILRAPKDSQNTNTHLALDVARTQLFTVNRGMRYVIELFI